MKKRSLWGMLALLLAFGFVMVNCSTVDSTALSHENVGTFTNNPAIPGKDFTSLGLVFSETTYDQDEKETKGDIYTYYALLKEVKKLNGDYMINIVIDKKIESTFGETENLIKKKVTWYGSATAIKYTDSLKNSVTTVTSAGNNPVTTTSQTYIMANSASTSGTISGGSSSSGSSSSSSEKKGFFK